MKKIKSWIKIIIFVLLIAIIFLLDKKLAWSKYISDIDNLINIKKSVNNNLFVVSLLYILITIVGCVLLALPGLTFAIIAGIIFGPMLGTFMCLLATTIGAMLAYIVGKYMLKDAIKPMLEKNKTLKKLLFSNDDKKDIVILMITRMIPIFPYNLQNFAYGITDIPFTKYSIYTFIFMFPGVALFTIGAAGITASENKWLYFAVAGIILVIVVTIGLIIKKKFLKES